MKKKTRINPHHPLKFIRQVYHQIIELEQQIESEISKRVETIPRFTALFIPFHPYFIPGIFFTQSVLTRVLFFFI